MWEGKHLPNLRPMGRSLHCSLPGLWQLLQLLHVQGVGSGQMEQVVKHLWFSISKDLQTWSGFCPLSAATQVDSKAFLAPHLVKTCPLKIRWQISFIKNQRGQAR